jgi:hypothetical protein
MLIVCSCCYDPEVRGDENNKPADDGIGFLVTRVYIYDEVPTFESLDGTRRVHRISHTVMENAGLVWKNITPGGVNDLSFWHMPDGRPISMGACVGGAGTGICIIRDGKARVPGD